jgi:hypothetical protein
MLLQTFTFGPLRVLVNDETGAIVAVQDSLTGVAASLLYSKGSIARVQTLATLAWESTAELA